MSIEGLSLRDYLAAQALIGLLASESGSKAEGEEDKSGAFLTKVGGVSTTFRSPHTYAKLAYELADAMLEVRG